MTDPCPIVSVVIPTRERSETLVHTLRSALRQDAADYEVLVSDNASDDRTHEVVAAISDCRLRYVRTARRLSMCDNWEFALSHVRGRYVIYIGDDDAVLPNGIDRLIGLINAKPSRAYMWTPPRYTWPIDGRAAEATFIPDPSAVRELDLVRMARFVISHGGWRYYEIPGVYHAAVEREVLDEIRRRTGRVFKSTQPDLFTSMCVPAFATRAVHTGRPVTLQGVSARSNAASSFARNGKASLERYIEEFGAYRVHPSLCPDLPLYARLIVDAILLARDDFPDLYGATNFNYDAMLAFLYRLRVVSKSFVLSHRRHLRRYHPFRTGRFLLYAILHDAAAMRRRFLNRLARRAPFAHAVPDNVCEFASAYDRWSQQPQPGKLSAKQWQDADAQRS